MSRYAIDAETYATIYSRLFSRVTRPCSSEDKDPETFHILQRVLVLLSFFGNEYSLIGAMIGNLGNIRIDSVNYGSMSVRSSTQLAPDRLCRLTRLHSGPHSKRWDSLRQMRMVVT